MQTKMNEQNLTATAATTNAQRDEGAEWRELRKKLLEHIVRNDAARKDRPVSTSNNHN